MAVNTLPPPPINDKPGSFTWLEWYRQLRNYVSTSGSVPWYIINFSGSSIEDIAVRDHNKLQSVQGGGSNEKYHLSADQYNGIYNNLELLDTTASVAVPTTPTIYKLPTIQISSGINYDSSTGVITFVNGGTYSFTLLLNAITSTSNKTLYFYAEDASTGTFAPRRYSARSALLKSSINEQTIFTSANYFPKGTQLRLYLWADSATFTLNTIDVPGTTAGTVTIPAARLMFAGSL